MTSDPARQLSIKALFDESTADKLNAQHYYDVILRTLKKILPADFFEAKETADATCIHQKKILEQLIPLIASSEVKCFPGTISFFALSHYCQNSFKFFFEMISRWLIPGERLNVVLVYASDFLLPDLSDQVYTVYQIMLNITYAEFEQVQRHFPTISAEIALGIHSSFYAQRILEIKGLSTDEKTALIQDFIAYLMSRFPKTYDRDVFIEMQHVLVMCHEEFKAARQARHLSRIIGIQYLFRKSLREAIKKNPQRRYLSLKLFRASIRPSQGGQKRVLGVLVGLNLLRDQEVFGENHLMRAIRHYIPAAQAVERSFFINKLPSEHISTIYLEIDKKDETDFTNAEIKKLRRELPINLKNRIEHRLHPVFMPRNEEEIMRNLLILSNQIKYVRDIPQISIYFDEQSHLHLYFTVILARVLKPKCLPIPDLFKQSNTFLEYIHDRTKLMGYIRKKYAKEVTVFHLKLTKESFLRADHSIDLYKARQTVVTELSRILGEVRDYNGGMISKQREVLGEIRKLLVDIKDYDELLLDNFFYSLAPVVVRALLDPKAFKTLFLMLLEGIIEYKQDGHYIKTYKESYNLFAIIVVEDSQIVDTLHKGVAELNIPSTELATAYIKVNGSMCIGYICCAHDPAQKEQLFQVLHETLKLGV